MQDKSQINYNNINPLRESLPLIPKNSNLEYSRKSQEFFQKPGTAIALVDRMRYKQENLMQEKPNSYREIYKDNNEVARPSFAQSFKSDDVPNHFKEAF